MRKLVATARDTVRAELWPIPTLTLVVAVMVGFLFPYLDGQIDDHLPGWVDSIVFGGDAGAARTVLDAIASSLITVTSLTFSLTVVTLQLASSQFSPRLLRTFTSDLFVQVTLAIFLATFVYSLTVLRAVRGSTDQTDPFVPRVAVTLAYLLAVLSVFTLVLFLAHLTEQIRIESMLRNVHTDADRTMHTSLSEKSSSRSSGAAQRPTPPAVALEVLANNHGFLTRVDEKRLLSLAVEHNVIIQVDAQPGSFLVESVPFARVWLMGGGVLGGETAAKLLEQIPHHVHAKTERTSAQDISFGLRQLTDVANKALSPGINDPTTAIHSIAHISAVLCDLSERELGPMTMRDDNDRIRVILDRPSLTELVEVAISQPRQYGAGDPHVMASIYRLLGDLAFRAPVDEHHVVRSQLARLEVTVQDQTFDDTTLSFLAALGERVTRHLESGTHHQLAHRYDDQEPA